MRQGERIIELDSDEASSTSSSRSAPRAFGVSVVDLAPLAIGVAMVLVVSSVLWAPRLSGPTSMAATPAVQLPRASPRPLDTPSRLAPPFIAVPRLPTREPGPVSAGQAPEAGVLYVSSDVQIYRYDGATGLVSPAWAMTTFAWETKDGVAVLGRADSADLLRWDGRVDIAICGEGVVLAVAPSGSCAYRELDDAVSMRLPGETARRKVAPADWGAGGAAWDPAGVRMAFLRSMPGPSFEDRGHNALWLLERDGALRELYRPAASDAFVQSVQWSPDGRWLTVFEAPGISNSVAADGLPLLLIEVATSRIIRLGPSTSRPRWSTTGELAYIRGAGRETWRDKTLVVRSPAGSERVLAIPDVRHVQLAPAWAGPTLAFVVGPSGAVSPDYVAGVGIGARYGVVLNADASRTEVRCPKGVVEGLRPAADGSSYLILCRAPGDDPAPLSIWWWRVGPGQPIPLLTGLHSRPDEAGTFGFYGSHPSLFSIVAWSKAPRM